MPKLLLMLPSKFALQEGRSPLDFIKVLGGAFKDIVMSARLVIDSLDGFSCGDEPFLKITSHLNLRKFCPAVYLAVGRTMQDQERTSSSEAWALSSSG